jgi:hypothetical protein
MLQSRPGTSNCTELILATSGPRYIGSARTTQKTSHVIATQRVHWFASWTYRKHMPRVRLRVHWSITSTGRGADDIENTASFIIACWTVFTEPLPGNALIKSATLRKILSVSWLSKGSCERDNELNSTSHSVQDSVSRAVIFLIVTMHTGNSRPATCC